MTFLWIDTETTGLDERLHEIVELTYAIDDEPPITLVLPHSLRNADPTALDINRYYDRGLYDRFIWAKKNSLDKFKSVLSDVTLAGSNPSFDEAFLKARGFGGWKHRKMDVPLWAAGRLKLPESLGLYRTAQHMLGLGYDIPLPDHTAQGDVISVRAIYKALLP